MRIFLSAMILSVMIATTGCGAGDSCGTDTNPATFTGLLATSVPSDASLSGSSSVTVTLNVFQPDVQQQVGEFCDSPQRYCGPPSFTIVVATGCQVTATVGEVDYDSRSCDYVSSSASITNAASCALDTSGGSLSMTVQAGTFSSTASSIQFMLSGVLADGSGNSATLQFQGS